MSSGLSFVADRDVLANALGKIQGVISNFETVPVLKTYHLAVDGQQLKLTATDLELGVSVAVPLEELRTTGDFAMPASKLNELISSVPSGNQIDFQVNEAVADVKAGRARWRIGGLSGSQFPGPPSFEASGKVWAVGREELMAIIDRLGKSVASESDLRVGLRAIAVFPNRMMSSDGEVLMVQKVDYETGNVQQIPGSCVQDLFRVLQRAAEDEVVLTQTEEFLFISCGEDIFHTRLLDNWAFPNIQPTLDGVNKVSLLGELDRQDLLAAIQRVKVTTNEERQDVALTVTGGKTLQVSSQNLAGDSATEELALITKTPQEDVEIRVAWSKLTQVLRVTRSDKVKIKLTEGTLAVIDSDIYLVGILMRRKEMMSKKPVRVPKQVKKEKPRKEKAPKETQEAAEV